MKLTFHAHISAKTHSDFKLKVFPEDEPGDFLVQREVDEGDESLATTCEYDFPDDSVVVARIEFGPALIKPDAPGRVTIEVHIGPQASTSVIAAAEAEAKELATQAGIEEHKESVTGSLGLRLIRYQAISFNN